MQKCSLVFFNFLSSVLFFSVFTVQAFAATGSSSSSSFFRKDFGLGVSLGSGFFDETKSSTFYQHSRFNPGLEFNLRLGLKLNAISFGGVGAYGINWASATRQNGSTNASYNYETYAGLAGGFVAVEFGAGKDGFELVGEYYGLANQTVRYSDDRSENPYKTGDVLSGRGWAIGVGGKHDSMITWLMYRYITYTTQNLDNIETNLPTTTHSAIRQQMLLLLFGQSF